MRSATKALVLQGGGPLGSYQGGVYQGLFEKDSDLDWVAGMRDVRHALSHPEWLLSETANGVTTFDLTEPNVVQVRRPAPDIKASTVRIVKKA